MQNETGLVFIVLCAAGCRMYHYHLSLMGLLKLASLARNDKKRRYSSVACSVKMAMKYLLKEFSSGGVLLFYQSAASKWGVIVG